MKLQLMAASATLALAFAGAATAQTTTTPSQGTTTTTTTTTQDPAMPMQDPAAPMQDPAMQDPAMQDPAMQDPAMQDPAMQDPAMQDPAMQDPAMQDPAMQDPAMVQDTADYDDDRGGFFDFSNGAYIAGDIGVHQAEMEAESTVGDADFDFSPDSDYAAFLRAGYRFNENIRLELEGGYRPGDLENVRNSGAGIPQGLCTPGVARTAAAPTCGPIEGELNASSLMLNAIFDLDLDTGLFGQRIVPFVGVGIGAAEVQGKAFGQLSNVVAPGQAIPTPAGTNPAQFQNLVIDDIERALAYQGILGLAVELSDNLSLDVTGRYMSTSDIELGSVTLNGTQGAGATGTITNLGFFEGPYRDASVTAGLRYTFAAPPPPPLPVVVPPPPPTPAPTYTPPVDTPAPAPVAQQFVVYFPFDQSVLTPEAQTIVQQAATYAQSGAATQIQVVGHADTSGSAAYNIRLSERRARAVADAMVGLGVNPGVITADWRGETDPAVPTGDGVKEPLNRRTTISVNF